jgi:hypothetical protein
MNPCCPEDNLLIFSRWSEGVCDLNHPKVDGAPDIAPREPRAAACESPARPCRVRECANRRSPAGTGTGSHAHSGSTEGRFEVHLLANASATRCCARIDHRIDLLVKRHRDSRQAAENLTTIRNRNAYSPQCLRNRAYATVMHTQPPMPTQTVMRTQPWKSGASAPRKRPRINASFSPGGRFRRDERVLSQPVSAPGCRQRRSCALRPG